MSVWILAFSWKRWKGDTSDWPLRDNEGFGPLPSTVWCLSFVHIFFFKVTIHDTLIPVYIIIISCIYLVHIRYSASWWIPREAVNNYRQSLVQQGYSNDNVQAVAVFGFTWWCTGHLEGATGCRCRFHVCVCKPCENPYMDGGCIWLDLILGFWWGHTVRLDDKCRENHNMWSLCFGILSCRLCW